MIFISHSSKDPGAGAALYAKFLEHGYDASQVFVDREIAVGERWQPVLYDRLRNCRALIVLCTKNWLGSQWCFAEVIYAKASGKEIVPVVLEECDFRGILGEHQAVRVDTDGDAAYERLWDALDTRHLGPRDDFGWPPKEGDTCPFPGLSSFEEHHAGVYFGREPETQAVLEELRKMSANGEPRLLMIVGGSGSGKSSLLKAGALPRLKHKTSGTEWVVLPTLRYGRVASSQHTVFDQLAMNVAGAGWRDLRDALSGDGAVQAFVDATRDLVVARGSPDATVLLPIDQFEELLAPKAEPDAAEFLRFLREVFGRTNGRLLAIGTIRSDYLDAYERHPHALEDPFLKSWRLGPFPRERVRDVIVKPAERMRVDVDPDLLDELDRATPSPEALPLLAFTLRKLYIEYARDGRLELREYETLGRMEGAIQKVAEAAMLPSLPPDVLAAVRLTFVKYLASVNDKDQVVRLTAQWSDVPELAKPVLEKFVSERLLVKDEREDGVSLEVAHEALFRAWPTLQKWLQDATDIQRWRRDVARDRAADPNSKALRPAQLAVARPWLRNRGNELTDDEAGWIRRSIRRERAKQALAALIAMVILGFGFSALWLKRKADRASDSSLGRFLASQSAELANTRARNYDLSLLLAIEGYRRDPSAVTAGRLRTAMAVTPVRIARLKHDDLVTDLAFSPDGRFLATTQGNELRVWDFRNEKLVASTKGDGMRGIYWKPDGEQLAAERSPNRIAIWDWRTNRAPLVIPSEEGVRLLATGAPEKWVTRVVPGMPVPADFGIESAKAHAVASTRDYTAFAVAADESTSVHVVDAATGRRLRSPYVLPDRASVSTMSFRPDGRALVIVSSDGLTRIWDWQADRILLERRTSLSEPVQILFSPDGLLVAEISAHDVSTLRTWEAATGHEIYSLDSEDLLETAATWAEFTEDGHLLATLGDSALRMFSVSGYHNLVHPVLRFSSGAVILSADVDRTGTFAAAGTTDGWVTVWRLEPGHSTQQFIQTVEAIVAPRGDAVALLGAKGQVVDLRSKKTLVDLGWIGRSRNAVFADDGQRFAWTTLGDIKLADLGSGAQRAIARKAPPVVMRFLPDGKQLLLAGRDGVLAKISVENGEETRLSRTRGYADAAFSPDGRFFAEKETGRPIYLYDVADGKRGEELRSIAFDKMLVFSPDGAFLVGRTDDSTMSVWSTGTKAVVREIPVERSPTPVVFDATGRLLAVAQDAEIHIFDTRDWDEVRTLSQIGGRIYTLAFTPDGRHLAAGCRDNNVRIWRVADGEPVMVIPQEQPFDYASAPISFTADGKYLIVTQDGVTRLVLWRPDDVIEDACRRVAREKLDVIEWDQFLRGQDFRETCSGN